MFRKASLLIPALVFLTFSPAECEVKLDGTLGTPGNVQGPNYSIEAAMGKQMGASLFHSFEKFDINTGENATFKGPADIERIISRVTGGNPSRIDGAIRSEIQGADFYFINPFGMIFGPNASLDITGSFFATSADYVKLGENGRFDAKNPENTVLTSDAPEAFGFLGQKPGDIVIQAHRLEYNEELSKYQTYGLNVSDNSRIMLAGGDIRADSGGDIGTHSGDLDAVSVTSKGELLIDKPDATNFESLGKIELNWAVFESNDGGEIKCQADSVDVRGGGFIGNGVSKLSQNGFSKAGDVALCARNEITVSGAEVGSLVKNVPGTGSGDIFIDTRCINITQGGLVHSETNSSGDSGDININASESLFISDFIEGRRSIFFSHIYSKSENSENTHSGVISVKAPDVIIKNGGKLTTESLASGNSGDISLYVDRLHLLEGGQVGTFVSEGDGKAGNINISASESVNISGNCKTGGILIGGDLIGYDTHDSSLFSKSENSVKSDTGSIFVTTPEIIIDNGGDLTTESLDAGSAGNITLNVFRLDLFDGGVLGSLINGGSVTTGDIDIMASESIHLQDSNIFSRAFNSNNSDSGDILIKTHDFLIEKNGEIDTVSEKACTSGDVSLDVANLKLIDGGRISASIYNGNGVSGDIDINVSESVLVSGSSELYCSGIYSESENSETTTGGNISILAPEVIIKDMGYISTKSNDSGSSGDICLDVDRLKVINGNIESSIRECNGRSGDIHIRANEYVNVSGILGSSISGGIFTNSLLSENGFSGNITIKASELNIEKMGTLYTLSEGSGGGGNISLDVNRLNMREGAKIDASMLYGSGKAGNIDINASEYLNINANYIDESNNNKFESGIYSRSYYSNDASSGEITIKSPDVTIEKSHISTISGTTNSGDIRLDVARLKLLGEGFIETSTNNYGKAGNIYIKASESVCISGSHSTMLNGIFSSASFISSTDSIIPAAGNILIIAPDVTIEKMGYITTNVSGSGFFNSGKITLNVDRLKILDGAGISTDTYGSLANGGAEGSSGAIDITASESVCVSGYHEIDGGRYHSGLVSRLFFSKDAIGGLISIKSPEIIIDHASVSSGSYSNSGSSGDIYLDVHNLLINGGLISASIEDGGNGKAGDIIINSSGNVIISDCSNISSDAKNSETARGGNIYIFSPETILSFNGSISCSSLTAGTAGMITIEGDSFLNLSGSVKTSADSSDGGNIFFNINDLFFLDNNALVSTAVSGGEGSGGNITISDPALSVLRNSFIKSSAIAGYGGNIDITTDYFIKDDASILNASSEIGLNGNININSPEIDLNSGLIKLAEEYQDPASFIKDPCIERMEGKSSSLTSGAGIARRRNPFSYFESSCEAQ